LTALESTPAFLEDELRVDTSSETNRSVMMGRFRSAGFDDELAEAMYRLDLEADAHPVYPDVPECLAAIRDRGCRIALVSDFHYDLRPELETQGIAGWFDAFVISYEHGFQKPDPRMFATALTQLGAQPREALMVGDRASHDGGAAAVGIDTLILPAPADFGPRGLDVVLRLL
jgi:HAD superfamily hydrolase (TIGR01509 family)